MKFFVLFLLFVCTKTTNIQFEADSVDYLGDKKKNEQRFNEDLLKYQKNMKNDFDPFLTDDQLSSLDALKSAVFVPESEKNKSRSVKSQGSFNIKAFLEEFEKFDCNRGFEEED